MIYNNSGSKSTLWQEYVPGRDTYSQAAGSLPIVNGVLSYPPPEIKTEEKIWILDEQRKIYLSGIWNCDLQVDVPVLYQLS